MPTIKMTDDDIQTAVHALRVAAERFQDDALTAREAGHPRLAEQFIRQATDSEGLAEQLEEVV
jgi:propanediol dehydratase small subunit